jgi:hypothetical protein
VDPSFDILNGATERDAERLETVAGLSNALRRMEEIAAATPGQYFLFEATTRSTLVKIDTRKSLMRSQRENKTKIA